MFVHVSEAKYVDGYKVWLKFNDGACGVVDLGGELWGEVFEPLKDISVFKQLSVDPVSETISWPNGADFAPEFLKELCEKTAKNN